MGLKTIAEWRSQCCTRPVGVASYDLLPPSVQAALPTEAELAQALRKSVEGEAPPRGLLFNRVSVVQRLPVLIAVIAVLVSSAVTGCSKDGPEADARASQAAASAIADAMRSTSPRIFQDSPVSLECNEAMAAAADVPLTDTNNADMQEAVDPCPTIDEYAQAIYEHKNTIGLMNITDQDVLITMQAVCSTSSADAPATGMCRDLEARGLSH